MNNDKPISKIKELESITIKAGARVYFVDAKMDSQGNKYIALSEVKNIGKGSARERQRIHIYQEDFAKIFSALGRALETLGYDLCQGLGVHDKVSAEENNSIASVHMPSLERLTMELEDLAPDPNESDA